MNMIPRDTDGSIRWPDPEDKYPKSVARIDIPATQMVMEGSWGSRHLGAHASTMELFFHKQGGSGFIEWDIPGIGETEHIGLSWDNDRNVFDYDGVFAIPDEAIAFLEAQGFNCEQVKVE